MEYFLFITTIVILFVIKLNEKVHCNDYRKDYRNYIKRVVSHLHSQIGSNEMLNLKLIQDSNNTINILEVFQPDLYINDFKDNYSNTINVLNYKYTDILKNFLEYINFIIFKCKEFQNRNLSKNFIYCVTLLTEEVKNSKTMFENLYNAMMFISYIDVKFLFNGSIVTNPIIEEIDFFQQYVLQQILETSPFDLNSLPNLKESKKKFKNLNEFYSEASEKVNKLLKNSNIIDTSININSTTIQIKECYNENDSYLVYLTCSKLNSFYDETIEIWYRKLGFEQFLNPNTPELMPPIDSSLVQNDGMQALNILRQETGWKKMDHIYIIYNGKQLNVDFILKGEINHMNFRIKKEHVTQLLRCRYTEIMKNYCVLLSSILHICNTVAYDFYYKCLIELFKSFNKSKLMVEGLYKSLITLNKSSIWSVSYSSYSILQKILKWVADIINLLNNNEFSQVYNDDLLDIKKIELVKRLLIVFLKFRDALRIELYSDLGYMKSRCLMKKSFYEMFQLIYDFKSSVSSIEISNFQWPIQVYHKACKFFNTFCENVYKSCYEDLGFKKVDCHNKSLDVKLHKFTVK